MAYTTTEASFYAIMGGVNKGEGIVITKGRVWPVDLWKIDPSTGRCVYGPKKSQVLTED